MEDIAVVHILLMGNLFEHVGSKESEFDLKGSSINREVFKFTMKDCLKDENLKAISKEQVFLRFQRTDMHQIISQVLKDIQYLNQHSLMDYSLLLITELNPEFEEKRKGTLKRKQGVIDMNSQPSVVKEVPEAAENDEDSFAFPQKSPGRDEFASMQNARMHSDNQLIDTNVRRQQTV